MARIWLRVLDAWETISVGVTDSVSPSDLASTASVGTGDLASRGRPRS